jgi:hypothetical protein
VNIFFESVIIKNLFKLKPVKIIPKIYHGTYNILSSSIDAVNVKSKGKSKNVGEKILF